MTTYRTRTGCCQVTTGVGGARPQFCEGHGERYLTSAQLRNLHPAPDDERDGRAQRPIRPVADPESEAHVKRDASLSKPRRKPLRRGKGFSASKAQRRKVEGLSCVACGREEGGGWTIDPAHLWPRGKGGCNSPDCVIPLCRLVSTGFGCHRSFDENQLELLPSLVRKGYHREMAHAIGEHEVSPGELIERCTGPAPERSAA